jgi:threonine dehydrogenase-like Zn-dependent dehydrogenase
VGSRRGVETIVEISSTAICGSDVHLYRPLAMFMEPGDILGHEPMGRVVEVGREVHHFQAKQDQTIKVVLQP